MGALRGVLPRRLSTTHLVYRGGEIALISQRKGKEVTMRMPPDSPDLDRCPDVFRHLLGRAFRPASRVTVETINGECASESEYLPALRAAFDAGVEFHSAVLYNPRRTD